MKIKFTDDYKEFARKMAIEKGNGIVPFDLEGTYDGYIDNYFIEKPMRIDFAELEGWLLLGKTEYIIVD